MASDTENDVNIVRRVSERIRRSTDPITEGASPENFVEDIEPVEQPKSTKRGSKIQNLQATSENLAETKNFSCSHCPKAFRSNGLLKRHLLAHSDDRNFKCHKCSKAFKWKHSLTNHLFLCCSGEKSDNEQCPNNLSAPTLQKQFPYRCENCSKAFSMPCLLRRHMRSHSDVRTFPCHKCSKTFKWKQNLKSHLLLHSDKETKGSETVPEVIVDKQINNLIQSGSGNSDQKVFECPECERTYRFKYNLSRHLKTHRKRDNELAECQPNESEETVAKICLQPPVSALVPPVLQDSLESQKLNERPKPEKASSKSRKKARTRTQRSPTKSKNQTNSKNKFCTGDSNSKQKSEQDSHMSLECRKCNSSFSRQDSLRRHMRVVHGEIILQCEACRKYFYSQEAYLEHQKTVCRVNPWKCHQCPQDFTRISSLSRHLITACPGNVRGAFPCLHCPMRFMKQTLLKQHMKFAKHRRNSSRPPVLSKSSPKVSRPEKVIIGATGGSSSKSSRSRTPSRSKVKKVKPPQTNDSITDSKENVSQLDQVGAPFIPPDMMKVAQTYEVVTVSLTNVSKSIGSRSTKVGKRKKASTVKKVVRGKILKLQTTRKVQQSGAVRKDHPQQQRNGGDNCDSQSELTECTDCHQKFSRLENLRKHIQRKHGKMSSKCTVCKKYFMSNKDLKEHSKIHVGQKLWKCPHCPRMFTRVTNRKRHIDTFHSNQPEPFQCTQCTRKFPTEETLTEHTKLHGEVKMFSCHECPKSFYNERILLAHQILHQTVPSAQCPCCPETFTCLRAFRDHLKFHVENLEDDETPNPVNLESAIKSECCDFS